MNDSKKAISIKTKIIFIVLINIFLLILILYIFSSTIIKKSYLYIENQNTIQDLHRANDIIEDNINQLTVKTKDWAYWDDTYKFIQDRNQNYIDSNLGITSFINLDIDLEFFYNNNNELVFSQSNDDISTELNFPKNNDVISLNKKLITHENEDSVVKGLLILPSGPIMISSLPILTSDGKGPVLGSLIFGSSLNSKRIEKFSELTHLSIKLFDFNSKSLPEDISKVKLELSKNGVDHFINPISKNNILGYRLLNDIYGNPALIIKIDSPRDMYNKSLNTIYSYIIISSIVFILFGFILVLMIKKFITRRLTLLSDEVEEISKTGDFSYTVQEGPRDEIGMLAMFINKMLASLSISKKIESEAMSKIEETNLAIKKQLEQTDSLNKLMVGRELKMIELKREISKLKGEDESS